MATIKYWDGSAWQYAVVGKQGPVGATGPTGPAGQASLQRFRYVATGGETSLSGTDANGNTLAYTSGLEEVFLNGVALVRGQDYTATNGTSITGLTALVASDVVEILAWGVFNVSNTISNTLVDAKGDLLVGSAADTVSRLAVGSANQVLTVDSSTATGLKWATPSGGMTLLSTTNLSSATVTISNISQDYNSLFILVENIDFGSYAGINVNIDSSTSNFYGINVQANESGSVNTTQVINQRVSEQWSGWRENNTNGVFMIQIDNYASTTGRKPVYASYGWTGWTGSAEVERAGWTAGAWLSTSAIDSMQFDTASFDSGTVKIYGVK